MQRHFYIQNVNDWIQIRVYKKKKESVTHFSQFISVKVKKIQKNFQAQFCEKLRKVRLRQRKGIEYTFSYIKNVYLVHVFTTSFTPCFNYTFLNFSLFIKSLPYSLILSTDNSYCYN